MVQAINTEIRTRFFEGAGQAGCMQKLRNLATTIKDAVLHFFQMILPCICKKKTAPVLQSTVAPQSTPPLPAVQATPPATRVTQAVTTAAATVVQPTLTKTPAPTVRITIVNPAVIDRPNPDLVAQTQRPAAPVQQTVVQPQQPAPQTIAVVPAQQPVVPIQVAVQQPIVPPQAPVGNINEVPVQPANGHGPTGTLNRSLRILSEDSSDYKAAVAQSNGKNLEEKDNDEKEVVSPFTQQVRDLLNMGSLKRNEWLAKNTPGKTDVSGRTGLSAEQNKAAYFVVLEAIELLCPLVKAGKDLKPSNMDVVLFRGKRACKNYPHQGNGPIPYLDVLNEHNECLARVEIKRARKLGNVELESSLLTDQAIQILVNNAKGKPLFASIFIAKDPANNPPIYGVVLKYNERTSTCELHLIEPYGGGDGAIFFRKFNQNDLKNYLEVNKDTRYTCIGVEVKD